ncbi:MAG: NTP transferase domain-containing protein [Brevinematales bacterium]|nr:NTP transferase domain-containing protein [Brevinematales bacterium]
MQAIVLAGGMGRHLKSAQLGDAPKPMAIVNARPFLEFVLLFLQKNGIDDIILSCGYMRPVIESYFANGKTWGIRIRYTEEEFLHGTAGSIKLAEKMIEKDTFLVVNGDTFHDVPVYDLLQFHISRDAFVTLALKSSEHPERYGAVELLDNKQIHRFLQRGNPDTTTYVNTGIYVFNKQTLNFIQPHESISLEKDIFPLLTKLGKLYGYVCDGMFLDIEVPENYDVIRKKLKEYI